MKNVNRNVLKIAILCTALPDIGAGTATPAIAAISQAMPQVSVNLIQMIVSIPSLCLIIFTPIYAKATNFIKKKTLVVAAFLLLLTGGILPTFMDTIYPILCMRILMGISGAIIMPVTVDLIIDLFEGKEKHSMMGYAAAITSIGGILFQLVGGYMGNIDWHYCFLAAVIAVPFYLFAIICLPDTPIPHPVGKGKRKRGKIPVRLWTLGGFMVMWEMLYFVFLTTASLMLVGERIGNVAQVGIVTSMVTIGGLIMSYFYGRIYSFLADWVLPLAYGLSTGGFIVLCFTHNILSASCGAMLIGLGYGLSAPSQLSYATSLMEKADSPVAVSMCYTARGVGGFISPFVFGGLAAALGKTVGRFSFYMAASAMCVVTLCMVVFMKGKVGTREEITYEK